MGWGSCCSSQGRLLNCNDRFACSSHGAWLHAVASFPLHLISLILRLLLGLLALSSLVITSAAPHDHMRGIHPKDLQYYESSMIWCRDKSSSFPRERLNDNFCDCRDGTDEPGTSACPESRFYCSNAGYRPEMVFSSRVNDGICDCCDGSDEYDGKIKCSNTCWEAGKKFREKLEKKLVIWKEGFKLRTKDVNIARHKQRKGEEELSHLKEGEKSLKEVVIKLKVKFDAVVKAEEEEELKRAKEEQERQEEEDALYGETPSEVKPKDYEVEVLEHATSYIEETPEHHEGSPETATQSEDEHVESLSKEELGKLVASRWVRDEAATDDASQGKSDDSQTVMEDAEAVAYSHEDHEAGDKFEENEADWEDGDRDDENEEDHGTPHVLADTSSDELLDSDATNIPWWKRVLQAPQNLLNLIGVNNLQFNKSESEQIKKGYSEANSNLISLQNKISELEIKLKQDFGADGEFFSFYGHCFEKQLKKYLYKICPYKQASQIENHATSRLGKWQGFEDDYRTMVFSNGDKCWHGPDRSLRVRLRCGLENEVLSIEEPSRCEYAAELATPAFCSESKLLELQKQWSAYSGLPNLHEEL